MVGYRWEIVRYPLNLGRIERVEEEVVDSLELGRYSKVEIGCCGEGKRRVEGWKCRRVRALAYLDLWNMIWM